METTTGDVDAESAAKKRRRSKWDTPAVTPTPTPSAVDSSIASNTAVFSGIPLSQPAMRPPLPMGLPIPGQPILPRMPPLIPLQMPMMPIVNMNTAVVPGVSKLDCRIYVGSLHYNISDADIRALFSPFGTITKVDMSLDAATGRSKGFCFVEFSDQASAIAALDMNAFEIGARKIKVGRPSAAGATVAAVPVPVGAPPVPQNGAVAPFCGTKPFSGKIQAQALLSQALGMPVDAPVDAQDAAAQPRAVVIRNIRNEINAAELHAVFLPFGAIVFCNFIGQESAYPSATGPVIVRSALIEYRQPSSTAECITNMNAFSLGGVHLLLDAVDATMATALKGSLQTVAIHKAAADQPRSIKEKLKPSNKNKSNTVILENLVTYEDASDPTLKGEIAAEAEKQGKLEDIEIVIDQKSNVKIILTYFDAKDAVKSFNVMNGRFFGGKTVIATLGT